MEQGDKSVERLTQNVNAYFPDCQRGEEEGGEVDKAESVVCVCVDTKCQCFLL